MLAESLVGLLRDDLRQGGVQRDHVAVHLLQHTRQQLSRGSVVVVDDHFERGRPHRLEVDPAQHLGHVAFGLVLAAHDPAHLVVRHPPDVLTEKKALELALAALVEVEALLVEDADVRRARIDRRRLHMQG